MTAVARPPRAMVTMPTAPRTAGETGEYVGRHRHECRARHIHAGAAVLAFMLAWIPAASAGRGRHRKI